jgi:hypothetical protein
MTLKDLVEALDLDELTPAPDGGQAVHRGYASDLLSDVLAHAPADGVLVTLQVHLNVIAVASHAGLQAVIFSCGRIPDEEIVERARGEGLALFGSKADTFEIVGRLYELGLRGCPD